mgnify:CR=1 FL=1
MIKKDKEKEEKIEYIEEDEIKGIDYEKKLKKLKKKLKDCLKEKEEYLLGWQRERADFINYRKEEEKRLKEREEAFKRSFLLKILPILDNLELAEEKLTSDLKENQWVKGILKIKSQIKDILKKEGVEEIKVKIKDKFDPSIHEAIGVEGEGEEMRISEIYQKGYFLNGKLLRPAKVKVEKYKK